MLVSVGVDSVVGMEVLWVVLCKVLDCKKASDRYL
jgi:hypothetical protein